MLISAAVLVAVGAVAFIFMREPGVSTALAVNGEPTAVTVDSPSIWRVTSRAPSPSTLLRSNEIDVRVVASDTDGQVEASKPSITRVTPGPNGRAETLVAVAEITRPARYLFQAITRSPVPAGSEVWLQGPDTTSMVGKVVGVGAIVGGLLLFLIWLVIGSVDRSRRSAAARRARTNSGWASASAAERRSIA
jgi:hypothetical protein